MPEIADPPPSPSPPTSPDVPFVLPPAPEPAPDPFADLDFDPATLDPSNLTHPGEKPKEKAPETAPEPIVDPTPKDPEQILDPRALKEPQKREESPNFKQLRELRKQAEEERDRYKAEVEAKNKELARLADLEEKSTAFEREQELLRQQLKEREKTEVLQATLRRTAARETTEWKQTASAIHKAVEEVGKILDLPEVKDSGLSPSALSLLDPTKTGPLNEVLKVLSENGKIAEANLLWKAHESVNVWRSQLVDIQNRAVEESKRWAEEKDSRLSGLFAQVREAISKANPALNPNSAEFKAMPKESQDFVMAQYREAETEAHQVVNMADRPDVLASGAFQNALVIRMTSNALKISRAEADAARAEVNALKEKLAAYEKAAGGAAPGGGSRTPTTADLDNLDDLVKSLEPRNMPGYKGLNAGL